MTSIHVMKNSHDSVAYRVRTLVGYGNSSARELSILSGCAHSLLSGLFRGRWKALRLRSAQGIAHTCAVSVGWILANEGPAPTREIVFAAVERARARHKAEVLLDLRAKTAMRVLNSRALTCANDDRNDNESRDRDARQG